MDDLMPKPNTTVMAPLNPGRVGAVNRGRVGASADDVVKD
jgi:hypothetical protein